MAGLSSNMSRASMRVATGLKAASLNTSAVWGGVARRQLAQPAVSNGMHRHNNNLDREFMARLLRFFTVSVSSAPSALSKKLRINVRDEMRRATHPAGR